MKFDNYDVDSFERFGIWFRENEINKYVLYYLWFSGFGFKVIFFLDYKILFVVILNIINNFWIIGVFLRWNIYELLYVCF